MKKGFSKPVNFDKIQEVTQGADKNLALFQGHLRETIHKYTNLDPISPEGTITLTILQVSRHQTSAKK